MRKLLWGCVAVALTAPLLLLPIGAGTASSAQASDLPDQIDACYIPGSGMVYRINAEGAPEECKSKKHVAFSWSSGGAGGTGVLYVEYPGVVMDEFNMATVVCPGDMFAANGGYLSTYPFDGVAQVVGGPLMSTGAWRVTNLTGIRDLWVMCINP